MALEQALSALDEQELSLVQNANSVRELFRFLDVVGGQHDRGAGPAQILEHEIELASDEIVSGRDVVIERLGETYGEARPSTSTPCSISASTIWGSLRPLVMSCPCF